MAARIGVSCAPFSIVFELILVNGNRKDIQKHLARFEFVPTGPRTSRFEVSLPDAEKPFFTASLTDSRLPAIPIPSRLVSSLMTIVQPPLLSGQPEDIQIATDDEWLSTSPVYDGRWKIAYIYPSEGGHASYGDGLHFPQTKPFWIGTKFTGTVLFPDGARLRAKAD